MIALDLEYVEAIAARGLVEAERRAAICDEMVRAQNDLATRQDHFRELLEGRIDGGLVNHRASVDDAHSAFLGARRRFDDSVAAAEQFLEEHDREKKLIEKVA